MTIGPSWGGDVWPGLMALGPLVSSSYSHDLDCVDLMYLCFYHFILVDRRILGQLRRIVVGISGWEKKWGSDAQVQI
jgi:hypothetical protein